MNKFLGISLGVLALAIAIVPNFTDCASQGHFMNVMGAQIPMACHWAGRAEIAVGAPLFAIGGVFAFGQRRSLLLPVAALGSLLGVMAILLPTNIIGTCPGATMHCNTVMKPALMSLGGLTVIAGLAGLVLSRKASS